MTKQEFVDYYCNLLIVQYRNKPKARAFTAAGVEAMLIDMLPGQVVEAYDLETAVGEQLNVIGRIVGVPGERVQRDFTGQVELVDDEQYRQLIKIIIAKNYSGTSLSDVQDLIDLFFSGTIQVFDHQNMSMGYYFDVTFGEQKLAEIFVRGGYLPKPMGVQLQSVVYAAEALTTGFFGFRHRGRSPDKPVGFRRSGQDSVGVWLKRERILSFT